MKEEITIRKVENGYLVKYYKNGPKECVFHSWRAAENFIMQHFGEHLKDNGTPVENEKESQRLNG